MKVMDNFEQLQALFGEIGVDTSKPGFYDEPSFIAHEKENPQFLAQYGLYVATQPYPPEYLKSARQKIKELCKFLHTRLLQDGRVGACVDMSGSLGRMLDREGVWNVPVSGPVTVYFDPESKLQPYHFVSMTMRESDAVVPHAWVIAPPFKVVDLTIKLQDYPRGCATCLPQYIMADTPTAGTMTVKDWMDDSAIAQYKRECGKAPTLESIGANLAPQAFEMVRRLGVSEVKTPKAKVKYMPGAVNVSDCPLEKMNNLCLSGDSPSKLYQQFLASRRAGI